MRKIPCPEVGLEETGAADEPRVPRNPFERSRFAADAFACQVAAVCVKE